MARLQSVLDALQVLLPGVFVVVVVWLGARYAVAGGISPGELVAFYGYAAFLMIPLRTATEFANKLIRARVVRPGASVACSPSSPTGSTRPAGRRAAGGAELVDLRTGCRAGPARSRRGQRAARRDRCAGRPPRLRRPDVDDDVRLGGVPLTALRRAEVRRRIVVSDTGASCSPAGSATAST